MNSAVNQVVRQARSKWQQILLLTVFIVLPVSLMILNHWPSAGPTVTPDSAKPLNSSGGITMANYNRMQPGMSYEEVSRILGSQGEELSSGVSGGIRTMIYKWDGAAGFGANMNASFQHNRLISKSQFGLK
ncbi:MAG TPA: hypothetical protein VFD58_27440 [Blastocatellia bacterium]|nr:hypothetical protein [Blastocatellia bacterium]